MKSEEYVGYGFNLYQEKNKPGQYIGRIEPGSPADKAGLKENDRRGQSDSYSFTNCFPDWSR